MSKLLLHIGLPKTGTTAIQELLALNVDRLADAGWSYPTFLGRRNHLALVALATQGDRPVRPAFVGVRTPEELDRYRRDLAEKLAAHTASGDWVFSSEHLASRLVNPEHVERVAEVFAGFDDIRVVMYVRPQDEMAGASHSTWVRDGRLDDFDIEDHIANDNRYNYQRIALRWIRVFGAERVDVRLYPGRELLGDFLSTLAVDPSELSDWQQPELANVSLTSAELAFLLQMNRSVPRWLDDEPNRQATDLSGAIAGSGLGARIVLSTAQRRRILEHFRAQNDWILENASNADGRSDYFDWPTKEIDGNIDHQLTAEESLHFATLLWNRASTLHSEMRQLLDEKKQT